MNHRSPKHDPRIRKGEGFRVEEFDFNTRIFLHVIPLKLLAYNPTKYGFTIGQRAS